MEAPCSGRVVSGSLWGQERTVLGWRWGRPVWRGCVGGSGPGHCVGKMPREGGDGHPPPPLRSRYACSPTLY